MNPGKDWCEMSIIVEDEKHGLTEVGGVTRGEPVKYGGRVFLASELKNIFLGLL